MTDYTGISNTQVEPEAPVTSELMTSLRDDPIAMAEGAVGAPKVQGIALDNLFAGVMHTNLVASRYKVLYLQQVTGSQAVDRIRFTTDTGSTWGSSTTFVISNAWIWAYLDLTAGTITFNDGTTESITVPSGYDGINFRSGIGSESVFITVIGGLG